jgi:hypothetical protein
MKKDRFGAELKPGKNLEVLQKSRQWFESNGDGPILRYYHCTDTKLKNEAYVEDEDLHECCICGTKLYRIAEQDRYSDSGKIQIEQKRHLVFMDEAGHAHHTCYRLNHCFRRVGYIHDGEGETTELVYQPPRFKDFLPEVNLDNYEDYIRDAAERSYEKYVAPFLKRWVYQPVNKGNVLKFIREWDKLGDHFLFYDSSIRKNVKQKLFNIIGVRHER